MKTTARRQLEMFTPATAPAPEVKKAEKTTYEWEGYQITEGYLPNGLPTLTIYPLVSKSRFPKPVANYYYRTVEQRDTALANFKALKESEKMVKGQRKAEKAAERAAQKSEGHSLKVGDCLYNSWGYDQTNVDYMQVVKVSKSSVWIRAIAGATVVGSEGSMSDRVQPVKDAFLPDDHYKAGTYCRTVRSGYKGQPSVSVGRHSFSPCEWGTTHYRSWYH